MYLLKSILAKLGLFVAYFVQHSSCTAQLFAAPTVSISEAPSTHQFALTKPSYPHLHVLNSPIRSRNRPHPHPNKGHAPLNSLFSGVYPLINLTWLGHEPQNFVAYVDTGSSDTWAVSNTFKCYSVDTRAPEHQSSCTFGTLYDPAKGSFTNITSEEYSITYFPENTSINGSMGYAPLRLGGLTVPKQEVALITEAAWNTADGVASSIVGLGFPTGVGSIYRNGSGQAIYDPIFTTMVKEGIVNDAVFTLAIDRVPRGTSAYAPAGTIALGGLVSPKYYEGNFTSVPIEVFMNYAIVFYATTHELIFGLKNGTLASGGTYQSIIDSGTSANFVPSAAAAEINAQFEPAAVYNETLGYWSVDCNAKAPYAAYKIGGKIMPMAPEDMIVRSLNGLPGYEDVCFSAFADGGEPNAGGFYIIGEVWQRSYVVAYDVGRTMLHFANRRPY